MTYRIERCPDFAADERAQAEWDRVHERIAQMETDPREIAEAIYELDSDAGVADDAINCANQDQLDRAAVLVKADPRLTADNSEFEAAAIKYFWDLHKKVMDNPALFKSRAEQLEAA